MKKVDSLIDFLQLIGVILLFIPFLPVVLFLRWVYGATPNNQEWT